MSFRSGVCLLKDDRKLWIASWCVGTRGRKRFSSAVIPFVASARKRSVLEVHILGPLEVVYAGSFLALGGTKQRAVLAMLALRVNRVVSVDFIIDGLWESAPSDPTNAVQVYVSRLRKVLIQNSREDAHGCGLLRRKPGYVLELEPEHLDLHRFQRLMREGSDTLSSSPDRAAAALNEALGLWRGAPLGEFAAEPFARTEVPWLEELRLTAVAARIQADLALGRHTQLIGELEDLIAAHPLHEGFRGQLILSLYRSGRQAEALQAYRRAHGAFADEVGIEPSRQLQQLHTAVLSHDPNLDWMPSLTPVVVEGGTTELSPTPTVWSVPNRNPHFSGRLRLISTIRDRLLAQKETLAVQTLYGLGGVGKTQLAIEYAHRYAADYTITWLIHSEQPVLIPSQLADLAERLGLPAEGAASRIAERVLTELGWRDDWLLIFDNAEHPKDIVRYLPVGTGAGHVLVTSRFPGWGALGGRVEVDVLERNETMTLLRARIPEMGRHIAEKIAAELGDLPLAAAQTAAYLEQTGLSALDYLRRFRNRRADLLSHGDVLGYQGRVDTTWAMSLERLRATNPTTVAILEVSAFLAPEPIPLTLFSDHPDLLGEPLRAISADPDIFSDALGAAVELSLLRRHPDGFQLHRLVQLVIFSRLPAAEREANTRAVLSLLAVAHPGDPNDQTHWPPYASLSPHVLATSTLGIDRPENRQLVIDTIAYLYLRGDNRATCGIAEELLQNWQRVLGPDEIDCLRLAIPLAIELGSLGDVEKASLLGLETLRRAKRALGSDHPVALIAAATAALAMALPQSGQAEEVRAIALDALDRCRNILGPDNHATLVAATASTMAIMRVGEAKEARALGVDTLDRCRNILGLDHPATLVAATVLALALTQVGEAKEARALGVDTLDRCRNILGSDHPATLFAATVLALALTQVGEAEQARALGVDTLDRCQNALGPNHSATLFAATVLALALTQVGEAEQARALGVDTLDRCQNALGPNHPTSPFAATVLALALTQVGEAEQARALGVDTLDRCRNILGADHPTILFATTVLALALTQVGEAEQARALAVGTLDRCQNALGPDHLVTLLAATIVCELPN